MQLRTASLRTIGRRFSGLRCTSTIAPFQVSSSKGRSLASTSAAWALKTTRTATMATTAGDSAGNTAPAGDDEFPRLTDEEKKRFDVHTTIQALKIPKEQSGRCMRVLQDVLYKRPGVKRIEHCDDDSKRLLLLREDVTPTMVSIERWKTSSENDGEPLEVKDDGKRTTLAAFVEDNGFEIVPYVVTLGYKDMNLQEVLKHYLPDDVEIPSSFEGVGHIAHVNLKEAVMKYKYIIGQVILDKNPAIKTVVNKVGTITSEYRVFDMELLAGEDSTETVVKQHGLRFKLDFRHVYWNSRLENEHSRLIERWMKPSDVVVDAMCGIGPFAVPAAKKGCRVLANDLNPESYRWLVENCRLNKVQDRVQCFNEDARAFLRGVAGGERGGAIPFDHIIMNLPASAVEFLDALKGEFSEQLWKDREMPMVHVYSFMQEEEAYEDVRRVIEGHLGGELDENPEFFLVRDVAPKKAMICSSFRVPRWIALMEGAAEGEGGESGREKRAKVA